MCKKIRNDYRAIGGEASLPLSLFQNILIQINIGWLKLEFYNDFFVCLDNERNSQEILLYFIQYKSSDSFISNSY